MSRLIPEEGWAVGGREEEDGGLVPPEEKISGAEREESDSDATECVAPNPKVSKSDRTGGKEDVLAMLGRDISGGGPGQT
jgi:hypothetical protein